MANFSSDSDEDRAVEQILAQALDQTVLEQVADLNLCAFTSPLPSQLETRFRKLKSFPTTTNPTPQCPKSHSTKVEARSKVDSKPDVNVLISDVESELEDKNMEREFKANSRRKSLKSRSSSSFSSRESVSPPRKTGCFWCSPKKGSRKKGKENGGMGEDEFLTDLGTFSVKGQRRSLRKAKEEEERISREAEKIIKWAKQESARMDVSGLDDELSDDEYGK